MALMAKRKTTSKTARPESDDQELDSVFVLKLVIYLILGSFWVRIVNGDSVIPLPVGLVLGLAFAAHDHFKIDRKVEYAFLLLAMFISFWLPLGLFISM
jgi:hypothetical protein